MNGHQRYWRDGKLTLRPQKGPKQRRFCRRHRPRQRQLAHGRGWNGSRNNQPGKPQALATRRIRRVPLTRAQHFHAAYGQGLSALLSSGRQGSVPHGRRGVVRKECRPSPTPPFQYPPWDRLGGLEDVPLGNDGGDRVALPERQAPPTRGRALGRFHLHQALPVVEEGRRRNPPLPLYDQLQRPNDDGVGAP